MNTGVVCVDDHEGGPCWTRRHGRGDYSVVSLSTATGPWYDVVLPN